MIRVTTIKGAKRHKVGVSVNGHLLRIWFKSKEFFVVPIKAIREILSWDKVYKSNYSFSFYNKEKGWHLTHPGTIRISDHWNFESLGKIHCASVPPIGQNQWAKGIWNEKIEKFEIVEYYEPNSLLAYDEFFEETTKIFLDYKQDFKSDLISEIEEGKRIAILVDSEKITFKRDEILFPVFKIKKDFIVIWKDGIKTKVKHGTGEILNGEEKINFPGARLRPRLRSLRNEK